MKSNPTEHKAKMQRVKESVDRRIQAATEERGVFLIFTGAGKGKTTAALGMALRCIGHGIKVGIIQFIKGAKDTAEERVLKGFGELVTFLRMGEGYTWETQDRERGTAFAQLAWAKASEMIQNPEYGLVILDELNIAIKHGYVSVNQVLEVVQKRPPMQHVVITGRGAEEEIMDAADLVSEMKMIKHPFRKGIKAQKGVEF